MIVKDKLSNGMESQIFIFARNNCDCHGDFSQLKLPIKFSHKNSVDKS